MPYYKINTQETRTRRQVLGKTVGPMHFRYKAAVQFNPLSHTSQGAAVQLKAPIYCRDQDGDCSWWQQGGR